MDVTSAPGVTGLSRGVGRLHASSRSIVLATAALSLAGFVSLLLMTRWGIGTSPDSVQYIRTARQLLGEHGENLSTTTGDASLVQRAPLYPLLLAAVGLSGLDPFEGARWLNALVFALNIFLVGTLVRRSSSNAPWLAVVASVLALASMPFLTVHAAALSEPLFLLLSLLGFLFLAEHLEHGTRAHLLAAAVAIGLTFLTRYRRSGMHPHRRGRDPAPQPGAPPEPTS